MVWMMPLLFVRRHNAKDRVMSRFPRKIGERRGRGDAEVRRDKGHQVIGVKKPLEDWGRFGAAKLNHVVWFGTTTVGQVCCTCSSQIPHPVNFPKGGHQPAFMALVDQGYRGG